MSEDTVLAFHSGSENWIVLPIDTSLHWRNETHRRQEEGKGRRRGSPVLSLKCSVLDLCTRRTPQPFLEQMEGWSYISRPDRQAHLSFMGLSLGLGIS